MKLTPLAAAVATATATALLALPTTSVAQPTSPTGCAGGDTARAATALYGAGTQVDSVETVAGLKTALVLEPLILPGTRHRMIAAGGQWCDATTAFNTAWQLAERSTGDGRAVAEAYASLAAAPYFDEVSVTSARGGLGTWVVTTHALTNGVDATWTVVTDGDGVASAHWVATGFAQRPFEAQWEGLTALPDATESYSRVASGALEEARGLPTAASAAASALEDSPGLSSETFKDGFTITVAVGDSHVGIDPGADTGLQQADIIRETMSSARINYRDFLDWGFANKWESLPGLPADTGYIAVNDALSAYCLACVFNSSDFNIHMLSEARLALTALGYDGYSDPKLAWDLIIGHEMFHTFQNGYNNPGVPPENLTAGRFAHTAYSEGTARFQESLHDYAEVGYAKNTLATAQNANGCNGFEDGLSMDDAMARGPFTITYNACFFWGPWYVANGKDALLGLVKKGIPAHSTKDAFAEIAPAIRDVTDRPLARQLAEFASASITGEGRAWKTWSGKQRLDWDKLFDRWDPKRIGVGDKAEATLGGAGVLAREITRPARVSAIGEPGVRLYTAVDEGRRVSLEPARRNSTVVRPQDGTRVYAIAVRPLDGINEVALVVGKPGSPVPDQPDAPTGPAQKPVSGTVTMPAPGGGERVEGVTSDYLEFKVPGDVDNARAKVEATHSAPGDIDIYLQKLVGDQWVDVASGESADVFAESTSTGRMSAGRYRLEVHNFAAVPGDPVEILIRFFNSKGKVG